MSALLPILSGPECLESLIDAFHVGVDQASMFYATNPRTAVSLIVVCLYAVYYLREVVKKPEIIGKEGKFKWFVKAECTQLQERYWPTCWACGTHAQTALANAIRNTLPNLTYSREYIKLPDGGQVSLDWYTDPVSRSNAAGGRADQPIAVFIPGLTGDSQTEYIKSLIPHAQSCGYRCVAFNNRGRGGMKLLSPKLYCAANCDDLSLALQSIKQQYPESQIVATGVSLGGILLCRYLTQTGHHSVVDVAVLISVCFDFLAGCESMEKYGLNYYLNQHLTRSLISLVEEHQYILEPLDQIDYNEVLSAKSLREFDQTLSIRMWGYESVEEYYRDASNRGKMCQIKVPTLCINAADDMFSPLHALPLEEVSESPYVTMVVTQRGGHIGFMEGLLPVLPFYSERLMKQFFQALVRLKRMRKDLC